jgi:SpoIID/LytB domain protein
MGRRAKRRTMGFRRVRTLGSALVVAALVLAVGTQDAAARWVVRGRGFGHGAGMSQYGAFGYAQHGRGYRWILGHYYQGTNIGNVGDRTIRVLLEAGVDPVGFTGADRACGKNLRPGRTYRFDREGSDVALERASGAQLANCGSSGIASGGAIVQVAGDGRYRGKLRAHAGAGAGLELINVVALDAYARGVVANEMPSSWANQALRVQAVAARSYALAVAGGGSFDVYDDTRSQVYGGVDSETASTNHAVRGTAGEVVRYQGAIATTYFSSTSGGQTESVQFAFPGASPQPYLKGVRDRYDGISPYHSWRFRLTQSAIESKLAGLFSGKLRRIRVLQTGDSPRIVRARVVGSNGSSKVSGGTLQSRLNLRSTWARFDNRAAGGGGGGGGSGGTGG